MTNQDTMMMICTAENSELVGVFGPEGIEALERALDTMLEHEALGIVPCTPMEWFLIGAPSVKPSLVCRGRGNGLAKLLWARSNGELAYVVVRERILDDMRWMALAYLSGDGRKSADMRSLVQTLDEGIDGEVLYAALGDAPPPELEAAPEPQPRRSVIARGPGLLDWTSALPSRAVTTVGGAA